MCSVAETHPPPPLRDQLGGKASSVVALQGMHCASWVVSIERALKKTPGVYDATVNLATQQAHVEYLPGLIDRKGLAHTVLEAGYLLVVSNERLS